MTIPDSEFGERVRRRLRDETLIWFTTTSADGTPQPNPVWFLWEPEQDAVLIYNATKAKRLEHVAVRPRVSLNFEADEHGGDVVVITGVAEQALDAPANKEHEAYLGEVRRPHQSRWGTPGAVRAGLLGARCGSGSRRCAGSELLQQLRRSLVRRVERLDLQLLDGHVRSRADARGDAEQRQLADVVPEDAAEARRRSVTPCCRRRRGRGAVPRRARAGGRRRSRPGAGCSCSSRCARH